MIRHLNRIALCMSLLFIVSCSSSTPSQPTGSGPVDNGASGSISFGLVWQAPSAYKAKAMFSPGFNACVDYGIDTVAATVYDGSNNVITSDSWPCSAHQGIVTSVRAGSNYRIDVEGRVWGFRKWGGSATGITVTSNQTTNGGTIVMNYTDGSDTTAPTVTFNAPGTTTNVPVTTNVVAVFNEPMMASSISGSTFTLTNGVTPASGMILYDSSRKNVAFRITSNLAYNATYTATITTGMKDLAGNGLAANQTYAFTTEAAPVSAPTGSPTGVRADPGNGTVTVYWKAVAGATSYNVYYATGPGVTTASSKVSGLMNPFVHFGRTNGQPYYYIVTAVNSYGEGPASSEMSATPMVNTLDSGLVAYYPFSGNANDASGNGNNGTVGGAALAIDRFGNANSAYYFNGSSSIVVPNSTSLNITGNQLTISYWIKWNGSVFDGNFKGISKGGYNLGTGYELMLGGSSGSDSITHFNIANGTTAEADYYNTNSFSGSWVHVAGVLDNSMKLYINGVLYAENVSPNITSPGTTTSDLYIGTRTPGNSLVGWLNGFMDDIRIYNRALSAPEVTQLYYAGNPNVPMPPSSLTATAGNGQNVISWPTVTGATSYNLYWSTSPILPDKNAADHVIRNATSPYTHLSLTSGQAYYYLVTSNNSYGESVESTQVTAIPQAAALWVPKASMPVARFSNAVASISGLLYAVGGTNYSCGAYGTLEVYDPVADSWTAKTSMTKPRWGLAAGVANGILYAVGGTDGCYTPNYGLNTLEAYNPATDSWSTKTSMPTPRYAFGLGVVNNIIYAIGGVSGGSLATVEAYDPVANTWSATAKTPMPVARYGFAAGVVNNIIYTAGNQTSPYSTVEAYDPAADSWTTLASMPTGRVFSGGGVGGSVSGRNVTGRA